MQRLRYSDAQYGLEIFSFGDAESLFNGYQLQPSLILHLHYEFFFFSAWCCV